jgi:hypothetical protein
LLWALFPLADNGPYNRDLFFQETLFIILSSYDFSSDRVENILRRDFELLRGCIFDITLKDVETVQRDRGRIAKWVSTARNCIDKYCRS